MGLLIVSMKSGLRDRNNEAAEDGARTQIGLSQ